MTDITFDGFDKLNRKPFAERLTKTIRAFSAFSDGAYVLSLNARFGSGKTTFIRMWKSYLEAEPNKHTVIMLNAWETDFSEDPILPICSAIFESIDLNKSTSVSSALKMTIKGALTAVALTSSALVEKHIGVDVEKIVQAATDVALEERKDIQEAGKKIFKAYEFKKTVLEKLKQALEEYANSLEGRPLVIFVDELDRCRPAYAVHFLETIKHIFSVKNVCFVLSLDREQLKASVRQLYGDVDFEGYYKKFVTREAELPEGFLTDYQPYVETLAAEYFDEKKNRGISFPFNKKQQKQIITLITELSSGFKFVPREVETFFRIFSQTTAIEGDTLADLNWIEAFILLIAISIADKQFFERIGTGRVTVDEVRDFIVNARLNSALTPHAERRAVSVALYACFNSDLNRHNRIYEIWAMYRNNKSGVTAQEVENAARYFQNLSGINETPKTPFEILYEIMRNWKQFIN